jgi:ABC-type transporter Mla subunit MlaD
MDDEMFGLKTLALLRAIQAQVRDLTVLVRRIMAVVDDLKAADAAIQESVDAAVTLIKGFQDGTVNADDPQVAAVVADLNAAAGRLKAVTPVVAVAAASPKPVTS